MTDPTTCTHCTCVGHSVTICCRCGGDRRQPSLQAIGLQLEIIGRRIHDRQLELDQHPAMAWDSQQRLRRLIAKDIATVLELETKAGIR